MQWIDDRLHELLAWFNTLPIILQFVIGVVLFRGIFTKWVSDELRTKIFAPFIKSAQERLDNKTRSDILKKHVYNRHSDDWGYCTEADCAMVPSLETVQTA